MAVKEKGQEEPGIQLDNTTGDIFGSVLYTGLTMSASVPNVQFDLCQPGSTTRRRTNKPRRSANTSARDATAGDGRIAVAGGNWHVPVARGYGGCCRWFPASQARASPCLRMIAIAPVVVVVISQSVPAHTWGSDSRPTDARQSMGASFSGRGCRRNRTRRGLGDLDGQ